MTKTLMIPPVSYLKLYIKDKINNRNILSSVIYNNSAEARFFDYEESSFDKFIFIKRINQNICIFFDEYEIKSDENET